MRTYDSINQLVAQAAHQVDVTRPTISPLDDKLIIKIKIVMINQPEEELKEMTFVDFTSAI